MGKEVKEKAEEIKKEAKETMEEIKKETKEKTQETKDKIEKTKEKAAEKLEDAKNNVEEKIDEVKENAQKAIKDPKNQKKMILFGGILLVIIILICIIAYLCSPRAKINSFIKLYTKDPKMAMEKYEPYKKYNEERSEVVRSNIKNKIKKIEKVNKNKYKVIVEQKAPDYMEVSKKLQEKLKDDKGYKENSDDEEVIAKNNKIELKYFKEIMSKADRKTSNTEFVFFQEEDGHWAVREGK